MRILCGLSPKTVPFSMIAAVLMACCVLLPPVAFTPSAQAKPEVKCSKCKISNRTVTGAWKQCERCGKWYCPSCQGGKSRLDCCNPNTSGINTVCSVCGVTSGTVSGNWRRCSQCGKKYCFQCQKGSTASPCCQKTLVLIQ